VHAAQAVIDTAVHTAHPFPMPQSLSMREPWGSALLRGIGFRIRGLRAVFNLAWQLRVVVVPAGGEAGLRSILNITRSWGGPQT
jgi:hypothetical protein